MWAYFVRTETADSPLEHTLKRQTNTQSVSWLTMKFPFYIKQGSYSFEPFKFHDFPLLFPLPFPVFHDFGYSCHLRKFSKLSLFLFRVFTLLSATDNTLVSTICAISKSRLILFVLILECARTSLANITSIFRDFQWPTIKFHDFQGLENEFLNFMTFQVFHDLSEPCKSFYNLFWFGKSTYFQQSSQFTFEK